MQVGLSVAPVGPARSRPSARASALSSSVSEPDAIYALLSLHRGLELSSSNLLVAQDAAADLELLLSSRDILSEPGNLRSSCRGKAESDGGRTFALSAREPTVVGPSLDRLLLLDDGSCLRLDLMRLAALADKGRGSGST
jgi:hypothetical protein